MNTSLTTYKYKKTSYTKWVNEVKKQNSNGSKTMSLDHDNTRETVNNLSQEEDNALKISL